jgi:polyisoprenoid-binding protein YceI
MKNLFRMGIVSIAAATALVAGTYSVDPSHSHVGFKVKHLMISNVKGDFTKFSGNFEYDEKSHTLKALHGTVEVASIDTGIQKRDDHLRSDDFFAQKKYPNITFELTKVEGDTAYGKLTMRGVTKAVELEIEHSKPIKDPWGNMRVGITLEGKVNRKDFGLKYNQILETGGVAVGETVKLEVELEGILQK